MRRLLAPAAACSCPCRHQSRAGLLGGSAGRMRSVPAVLVRLSNGTLQRPKWVTCTSKASVSGPRQLRAPSLTGPRRRLGGTLELASPQGLHSLFKGNMCNGDACTQRCAPEASLQSILASNRTWAESRVKDNPEFFSKLVDTQAPEWLWIGCSDSRVPANELLGLGPGEVFVQRNVGNLATHKDMNVMSCMEYAVGVLKVKHIIVCGHYGCGAVKGALTLPCKTSGLVNLWIQDIRDTRDKNIEVLRGLSGQAQVDKLVELNVMRQVFNVCTSPIVQQAWDNGQELAVHGLVYALSDGILKPLTPPVTSLHDFEEFSHEQDLDGLRHLSLSVLEHMSFEREALRRTSMERPVQKQREQQADDKLPAQLIGR